MEGAAGGLRKAVGCLVGAGAFALLELGLSAA